MLNTRLSALALLLVVGVVAAQTPARHEALFAAATAAKPQTIETLKNLVNIETGSANAEGMAAMTNYLEGELKSLGASVTRSKAAFSTENPAVGENIYGTIKGTGSKKILMIAHMDTVHVKGTLAKQPWRIATGVEKVKTPAGEVERAFERAYGPGVADAKSGVATILNTVRLLQKQGFKDFAQITMMFNTDEEIGSDGSKALIQQLASQHDVTLSYEPTSSVPVEAMILAASGSVSVTVKIKGKSAHAGAEPEKGVNALVEMSDFVLSTMGLDNKDKALRFNWTIAQSGAVFNIIPDEATITATLRYLSPVDRDEALAKLKERVTNKKLAGSEITLIVPPFRPSFIADAAGKALVTKAVEIYKEVGGSIYVVPVTGAGTDAAFAALSGKPVLEALGLPGFGYHSNVEEYADIGAIPRRLYLSSRLIMEIAQGK
ncbi:MAG: glutamate carboxypeptidase [Cytophagales bacterium]|nr:glutamate carboxypeptidase [Cytophagales bacterium]